MTEKNFHTVMELAEKVGVPRTTINDWLAKFSQFAEFSMQGKRRVYSDSTLSVLLKISELRTAGKSSFEIEQELTRLYAVHPEAAEEPEEEKSMPAEEKPGSGEPFPDASANALVVKQQTDELARLLGAGFQDIRGRMEALESKAHRNAVRSWFFFALASVLILLMSFGGLLVYRHALDRKESDRNRDAALTELTAQSSALREGNADLKEQLKNLRTGMVRFAEYDEPDTNPDAVLLDVREEAETVAYAIPGAVHTDLYYKMDVIPFDKIEKFYRANLK